LQPFSEHENESKFVEQLAPTPVQLPSHVHPSAPAQSTSPSVLHGAGEPPHVGTPDPGPVFPHQPNSLQIVPVGQSDVSRHFETQM
jgi:hypothetical protein